MVSTMGIRKDNMLVNHGSMMVIFPFLWFLVLLVYLDSLMDFNNFYDEVDRQVDKT